MKFRRMMAPVFFLLAMCLIIPPQVVLAQYCCDRGEYVVRDCCDNRKDCCSLFTCEGLLLLLLAAGAGAGAGYAAGHNRGKTGDDGEKGDKGDKGDTGPQGPQGVQGPAGASASSSSSCCGDCNGNDTDEGETLTFNVVLDVGATPLGANAVVTPFVTLPNGVTRLGTNFTNANDDVSVETQSIIVSDPCYGTYHVGVQFDNNDSVNATNLDIDITVVASRDSSTTTIANTLTGPSVTTDVQLAEDFSYESTGAVP